ncbi:MAG TPA: hypothetical protein VHK91_04015 [Flavisolibacter sp.]|jgi:hypothetical protein|nr:hypothetical protein [Flavisolibacter sp.]
MQPNHLAKAGGLAVLLLLAFFISWEAYLRQKGIRISYDDDESLWSDKRARVYEPSDKATVFIGSSRIKFDLDIETWRKLTGQDAVQLAMQGTSPMPVLLNLADDPGFKGKLVVDVTEGLFFSSNPGNTAGPLKNIAYYKKRTPAQRASFQINHALESRLVFLDKDFFSLGALIGRLHIPNRPGIYGMPDFPQGFHTVTFDRRAKMTDKFLADTNKINKVRSIWFEMGKRKTPPPTGNSLDSMLQVIQGAVARIKARGGQVIFLRTPSSGPFLAAEEAGFPRAKYWERILEVTQCPGIHFKDYPAMSHFQCPEFSHLSPADAIPFTQSLVQALEEKGWNFSRTVASR